MPNYRFKFIAIIKILLSLVRADNEHNKQSQNETLRIFMLNSGIIESYGLWDIMDVLKRESMVRIIRLKTFEKCNESFEENNQTFDIEL